MGTVGNSWINDIQDKIYSRLSAVCDAKLSSKYADINVTMDSHVPTTPTFPNVYIHFMTVEVGKDLVNQDVNAIYLTAEIEITVTNAQGMTVANEVTQVATDCMKEMRFDATNIAEFRDTESEYRTVSRFARYIGGGETLYEI